MSEGTSGPFKVEVKLGFPGKAQHEVGVAHLEMTNNTDRTIFVAGFAKKKIQRPLLKEITFDFSDWADAPGSSVDYFTPPVREIQPGETVMRDELIPATMRHMVGKNQWTYEINRVGYVIPYSTKPLQASNPLSPSSEELNQWRQGLIKGTCEVKGLAVPELG